ncbi:hypothetical protein CBL_02654 [Carabus blaptoides fortunei]
MRILGVLILILYLILLLTGIYCTFAANVTEQPEPQPEFANNCIQQSSESSTSPNSPGSVFGSFLFFPYPVIAPNNAYGRMIRNFFRNNTFGAGWVPLPMRMSMMNSTKSVVPSERLQYHLILPLGRFSESQQCIDRWY